MSLLLSLSASSNQQLTGRSRTIQRVVLTAALTFVVALAGTTREVERVRGATLTAKASLQGQVREVERTRGSLTGKVSLSGRVRQIERLPGATLTGKSSLTGRTRTTERLTGATLASKTAIAGRIREIERITAATFTTGGGAHPVGIITRLSLDGYGARRAGSFTGKDGTPPPSTVGRITRLSLDGYGAKRAGSFAGRVEIIVPPPAATGGGGWHRHIATLDRQRKEAEQIQAEDEELLEIITIIMATKDKWEA